MNDELLDDLLVRWQEMREQGRTLTAAELCPNRPDLAPLLRSRMQAVMRIEELLQPEQPGDRTSIASEPPFPADAAIGSRAGQTIPGLEIIDEIGRGGMGVVYRAVQTRLKRTVALKMILHGQYASSELRARFQKEAEAVAQLQHPHIVQIHEVGEHEGSPFLVLEFVEGGSLAQHIASTNLPARRVAELIEMLASAIQAAHEKGIAHRDLKPSNVLLTSTGIPKIADFGLARQFDSAELSLTLGGITGTPGYMAPEQVDGGVAALRPPVDIHALGAIMYELLTGRPPFRGKTIWETFQLVRHHAPVPPSRVRSVHRDLETICLKCLNKAPERRYPSARELALDVRRFLDGEPIVARATGPTERVWRWAQRKPALAALMTTLVLGVLLGVPAFGWNRLQLRQARYDADIQQRLLALSRRAEQFAEQKANEQESFSLLSRTRERNREKTPGWVWDGLRDIVRAARMSNNAEVRQALRNEAVQCLTGFDLRESASSQVDFVVRAIAYSLDGKVLAIAQDRAGGFVLPCQVVLLGVERLEVRRRLSFMPKLIMADRGPVPDGVRSLVVGPDGKWLAVGTRSGMIHYWDLQGSDTPAASWAPHRQSPVNHLEYCARINVLFSASSSDSSVRRWSLAQPGQQEAEYKAPSEIRSMAVNPDGTTLACLGSHGIDWLDVDTLAVRRRTDSVSPARLQFSPDGRFLAASAYPHIVLIDSASAAVARRLQRVDGEPSHAVGSAWLKFHPDGTLLSSVSDDEDDRGVRFWETSNGRLQASLFQGGKGPLAAAIHPDGESLALANERRVVVFELARHPPSLGIPILPRPIQQIRSSADGNVIAALTDHPTRDKGGLLSILETSSRESKPPVTARTVDSHVAFALHPSDIVSAFAAGNQIRLLTPARKQPLPPLTAAQPTLLAFSHDGTILYAVTGETDLQAWEWSQNKPLWRWSNAPARLLTGMAQIYCLAVSPEWVLAGGRDGVARILHAESGEFHKVLPGSGSPMRCAAITSNSRWVACGYQTGIVRLLSLAADASAVELHDHFDGVTDVGFDETGKFLLTASRDRRVHLYASSSASWQRIATLHEARGPILQAGFLKHGTQVLIQVQDEAAPRLLDLDYLRDRLATMGLAPTLWPGGAPSGSQPPVDPDGDASP